MDNSCDLEETSEENFIQATNNFDNLFWQSNQDKKFLETDYDWIYKKIN